MPPVDRRVIYERDGAFYVVQFAPDIAPQRIKLGWAFDPTKRLAEHRCAAPTARLVRSWPCPREREQLAIAAVTRNGCRALSRESFDTDDLAALVGRVEAFFSASSPFSESPSPSTTRRHTHPLLTRLRAVRVARALSQAELAERSGVSRVAITRLERGTVDARFATIRRLAEALGVEPLDLMASEEPAA